jgi:hypothetical protein
MIKNSIWTIIFIFYACNSANSQAISWTVKSLDNPSPGYLNLEWVNEEFYLLDNYGKEQFRDTAIYGMGGYKKLLKNGLWMSMTFSKIYLFNQEMQLVDSIPYPDSLVVDNHEFDVLSNGHYLLLCIQKKIIDVSKIVDSGSTQAQVLCDVIIETDRTGKIFWEWNSFDHYKITDVTSDIDLTQPVIDWSHINSIWEDKDGNLLFSVRHFDEITKIDKNNGQIIWRMGGSKCKNNQFSFIDDDYNGFTGFSHQHSVSVLPNGNILLFDNGNLKEPQFSRAVEYQIDQNAKTAKKVWEYRTTPDLYQPNMGSAYRQSNGTTIINFTFLGNPTSRIIEVRPDNSIAFELNLTPIVQIYRATRYITRSNAVIKNITTSGLYDFSEPGNETGVSIDISSIQGSSSVSTEKHYYPPIGNYLDSSFTSIYPYRWVVNQYGINDLTANIILKTSAIANLKKPEKALIYFREKEANGDFKVLPTTYNSTTKEISAPITSFGEFSIGTVQLGNLILKSPASYSTERPIKDTLKWMPLTGAKNYQIQISLSSDFAKTTIDQVLDNTTQYEYQDLKKNTVYYWRVRGMNTADTSDWSHEFVFQTTAANSVDDFFNRDNDNFVFPNPAENIIYINNYTDNYNYILYNQFGIIISKGLMTSSKLDISNLSSGSYILLFDNRIFRFIKL